MWLIIVVPNDRMADIATLCQFFPKARQLVVFPIRNLSFLYSQELTSMGDEGETLGLGESLH